MLGKGSSRHFRRTASMTGMSFDEAAPPDPQTPIECDDHRSTAMILSPRYYRRISSTFDPNTETSTFLRACELCNCRLAPDHDIYMYRGDKAFCSQECREQQIKQDEKIERITFVSNGGESQDHSYPKTTTASKTTGKSEAIATA